MEISNLKQHQNKVSFDVMRIEGADVYGSFLIKIDFHNHQNEIVESLDMKDLSNLNKGFYVAIFKDTASKTTSHKIIIK